MAAPATRPPEIDIVDPLTYAENGYPHEIWTHLRNEAPVSWIERPEGDSYWAITKHADITMVGKNPDLFISSPSIVIDYKNGTDIATETFDPPPMLISMDGEQHRKYRKLISKHFTPRALLPLHADIERIAKRIVDDMLELGDEGTLDFVERVAAPLPIAVIAWLLGVPESDWELIYDWTNRTAGFEDPDFQKEGESAVETSRGAMIELFNYFTELTEERRKNPKRDLITLFTHAEVDGKKLELMDVLAWCFIIVVAGNETTRNATTGGLKALAEHPDQLRRVQQDMTLLKPSVEEMLRWTSPLIHFARTCTADTELRGQTIREGEKVGLFYPSANRDEEVFDRPFEFDVTRQPNRHIAFGVGEHFCAGAHVARLEMQVAFKHLLPRIEEVEVTGPPNLLQSSIVGGVKHLPIRYKLRPA